MEVEDSRAGARRPVAGRWLFGGRWLGVGQQLAPGSHGKIGSLAPLAGFLAILTIWEAAVQATGTPVFVLPPPSIVLRELAAEPTLFVWAFVATLTEAIGGLVLATATALGFAVGALYSRSFDRVVTPLVVISQTVPVITLAPLLILWFGYGPLPRIVVCALVSFFPMAVTSLEGFRSTDRNLLLLFKSVDASRWDTFWRLRLPCAGPFLASAARTGVTLSLVGAVVAEWTAAGKGLGYIVLSSNARLATGQAFAAVLLICVLGLGGYACVSLIERRVGWWKRANSQMTRTLS